MCGAPLHFEPGVVDVLPAGGGRVSLGRVEAVTQTTALPPSRLAHPVFGQRHRRRYLPRLVEPERRAHADGRHDPEARWLTTQQNRQRWPDPPIQPAPRSITLTTTRRGARGAHPGEWGQRDRRRMNPDLWPSGSVAVFSQTPFSQVRDERSLSPDSAGTSAALQIALRHPAHRQPLELRKTYGYSHTVFRYRLHSLGHVNERPQCNPNHSARHKRRKARDPRDDRLGRQSTGHRPVLDSAG